MNDLGNSLAASASGMEAQANRIRYVSENIANADTPGYRRKLISFEQVMDGATVRSGKVRLDQQELPEIYSPGHPMANEAGYYKGSNVDLMIEIADAREAQRSYDANVRLFDQARQMMQSLFEVLRR
ncbi:flagellar basal body rod protein FlgC [Xinfangfangia sp. D13-10-4-6]|uniref:flagellar basal body rod protein FlgC n=1 Tax=Pseudogemmobacter hezensis TaxID=2737662 RepID=UPI001551F9AC|nr:flagellar basal body rod protein FlgC [Pseudogemmobacter hezensis]NPD16956.1 flagellar basal body rod protein FlgC [Pseudogemmobacter hezensis]